ncbi:hypothetical protein S40293_05033 [Stachybotrys chartarum IBT 40293]|nr:hypothetical protein S40293_05033 [Stachybotrys chartarum IBT 40293]
MASYIGLSESLPQYPIQSLEDSDHVAAQRKLLVIYIHGFCGSEESFGQFPSHVHCLLKQALRDTHVVYSKIYPQYETRNAMDIAVEIFSRWLEPHEDSQTDIILVAHSLGGILAAEAALLKKTSVSLGQQLRHHVVGTISMDCPFLGLNPGIIVPGILSLFRPKRKLEAKAQCYAADMLLESDCSALSQLLASSPSSPGVDAYFNPPFFNDKETLLRNPSSRTEVLQSFWLDKFQGWIREAINYYFSYWEYGRCMRHPQTLRLRYRQLRALEDADEFHPSRENPARQTGHVGRQSTIRFLNYFTASTQRPACRKPEAVPLVDGNADKNRLFEEAGTNLRLEAFCEDWGSISWNTPVNTLGYSQPTDTDVLGFKKRTKEEARKFTDGFVGQRQPRSLFHRLRGLFGRLAESLCLFISQPQDAQESQQSFAGAQLTAEVGINRENAANPVQARTFCLLPPKADPAWVRIFMEGTDEVDAHCSLFADDAPHYEELVLHMGKEIAQWIHDCNNI